MHFIVIICILFLIQASLLGYGVVTRKRGALSYISKCLLILFLGSLLYSGVYFFIKGLKLDNSLVIGIVVSLLVFLIAIYLVNRKINKLPEYDEIKRSNMMLYVTIIVVFCVVAVMDIKPLYDKKAREKELRDYAIEYLNKRYGDGKFKIVSSKDLNDCDDCLSGSEMEAYEFVIETKYLDDYFTLTIEYDKEIYEDTFLSKYSNETDFCKKETLNDCLDEIVLEKEGLQTNYDDYDVVLSIMYSNNYGSKNYGKIPSLQDLAQDYNISFISYKLKNYYSEDEEYEFTQLMIKLYKDYISKFSNYGASKDDIIEFNYPEKNDSEFLETGHMEYKEDKLYIYKDETPIIVDKKDIYPNEF